MTEPRGEVLWTPPPDVWERTAAGRPRERQRLQCRPPSLHAWSVGGSRRVLGRRHGFCGVRWRQPPAAMRRNRDAGRPLVPRRTLNYAEHALARQRRRQRRAVIAQPDPGADLADLGQAPPPMSCCRRPRSCALGVEPGDRVVAYAPNIPRRSWRSSPRRQSRPSPGRAVPQVRRALGHRPLRPDRAGRAGGDRRLPLRQQGHRPRRGRRDRRRLPTLRHRRPRALPPPGRRVRPWPGPRLLADKALSRRSPPCPPTTRWPGSRWRRAPKIVLQPGRHRPASRCWRCTRTSGHADRFCCSTATSWMVQLPRVGVDDRRSRACSTAIRPPYSLDTGARDLRRRPPDAAIGGVCSFLMACRGRRRPGHCLAMGRLDGAAAAGGQLPLGPRPAAPYRVVDRRRHRRVHWRSSSPRRSCRCWPARSAAGCSAAPSRRSHPTVSRAHRVTGENRHHRADAVDAGRVLGRRRQLALPRRLLRGLPRRVASR